MSRYKVIDILLETDTHFVISNDNTKGMAEIYRKGITCGRRVGTVGYPVNSKRRWDGILWAIGNSGGNNNIGNLYQVGDLVEYRNIAGTYWGDYRILGIEVNKWGVEYRINCKENPEHITIKEAQLKLKEEGAYHVNED